MIEKKKKICMSTHMQNISTYLKNRISFGIEILIIFFFQIKVLGPCICILEREEKK